MKENSIIGYNQKRLITALRREIEKQQYDINNLTIDQVEEIYPVTEETLKLFIAQSIEYDKYVLNLSYKYNMELYSYPSSEAAQQLLFAIERMLFDIESRYIVFYIRDLEYGTKWRAGMVTDREGNDKPLQTVDDLWYLLLDNIRYQIQHC